jgi:hypothetical protein
MRVGDITGFGDRPRRNVEVRIGRRELFSEIADPPGVIRSRDVVGIRVSEELLDAGKHVIHLHLDTNRQKSILFYTGVTRFDIALLLDELEASLGDKPRKWETIKLPGEGQPPPPDHPASPGDQKKWKRVEDSKVCYQLTGESKLRAVSIPAPPTSKKPAIVRITHQNGIGRVDSDVFVRLGKPKAPLKWNDFETVSDWKQAPLVEDLLDSEGGWMLRGKAKGEGMYWSGTYEAQIQFPKGHHLIEIKLISRVPEVCSIVLSNWKVYVQ